MNLFLTHVQVLIQSTLLKKNFYEILQLLVYFVNLTLDCKTYTPLCKKRSTKLIVILTRHVLPTVDQYYSRHGSAKITKVAAKAECDQVGLETGLYT